MFEHIRIILVSPSHPGNIGATARAMKNMGLTELYLVRPKDFPSQQAIIRASGADDVLAEACVVESLSSALQDCHVVYGTSARTRSLEKPTATPRQAAAAIAKHPVKTAIVFGRESTGLTNEELAICHQHIIIPTAEYRSLNLAAAVQVISYELRIAASEGEGTVAIEERSTASVDQILGFYQQLQRVLIDIKFLDPKQPKMLMQRLQRLFNRAQLDTTELNILRGILSRVERLL